MSYPKTKQMNLEDGQTLLAAVDGKMSDLKSALSLYTGNEEISFSDPTLKQYIVTNGTTVQWDTPSTSSSTQIKWAVVECNAGDVFIINGKGGNTDRLWAFADSSKNILVKSNSGITASNLVLSAPIYAKYLIINDETNKKSYIGKPLIEKVSDLELYHDDLIQLVGGESQNLHNILDDVIGAYWNQNFEEVIETGTRYYKRTILIDVEKYDRIRFEGGSTPVQNHLNWFVTENNQGISSFDMAVSGEKDVPANAKYVTFSQSKVNETLKIYGICYGEINKKDDSIEKNTEYLTAIQNDGYSNLLNQNWVRGGWYTYDDFRSDLYPYRAAINTHVHFNVDTQLLCKRGFQIIGAAKINGEIVSSAGSFSCMFYIPAGADASITVRRIAEDTTEVLTDEQVHQFADAVMITSVRGSDYMLTRETYTGIEMFETMGIIGDSYSAGNNSNNWGKCLGRMIGTEITVWAQSGYTSQAWITTYLPRLLEAPSLGLYWINLGINDGSVLIEHPEYLGTSADVDEITYPDVNTFPNTFWGNIGRIIRNIQIHAPNAKIVLEKTLFANMRNAQVDLDTTKTLTINNTIAEIAEHYGIPCIDQLDDPFYTSQEYSNSMTQNHPRAYTWPGMANANRRLFAKAVFDNPEYFY